jgi:hypothetical protein
MAKRTSNGKPARGLAVRSSDTSVAFTTNNMSARPVISTRRAAFVLALSALRSICGHADENTGTTTATTRFDGLWQTTLSCTNANGALGYSFRFPSTVKNGVLHGEKGTAHEAGWLQIDGSLRSDGMADLYVEGLVGAAAFAVGQRPTGTPYGYHIEARFSGDRAEGHRIEGRPCTVLWTRGNALDAS